MEAASLALSAVQTLLTALQCANLKELSSMFDSKSNLNELKETISTVEVVLLDAETKQQLSAKEHNYIQKLKDAIYDADDLFDELSTLAAQEQLNKDGKASEKLQNLFSRIRSFFGSSKMSKRVKKIKTKLEGIANDHNKYGLGVDIQPIRRRSPETCSYVNVTDIIGRDIDVEKIVKILLDRSATQDDVSFLPIVGMGGLGKTALAKLVYSDEKVKSSFELKFWACVSDDNRKGLDAKDILCKILNSSFGENHQASTLQWVQKKIQEKLNKKRYLLVLDDVWNENAYQWGKLIEILKVGMPGSWIVVTTRSDTTASIVGNVWKYDLKALSQVNSWRLFKEVAFGSEQCIPHDELVNIGLEITERCAGVPLALKVVASLLHGQDKSKWLSFQKLRITDIRDGQNDIMPILEISYHNLESSIKSCFSYCALFPKDFELKKDILIRLWIAQGYIVPLDKGQSIDDAAEEYFSILLRRCFFQDVTKVAYGEIESCKIHDFMHDLAQKVAGKEIHFSNPDSYNVDEKVRHLAHMGSEVTKYSFTDKIGLRSLLHHQVGYCAEVKMDQHSLEVLVGRFKSIRALDLSCTHLQCLPKTLGKLLHLRYLNLSNNRELEELPKSIVKLYNLQTLMLHMCDKFKRLPEDISMLHKLRVLEINGCNSLSSIPTKIGELTELRVLSISDCKSLTYMPIDIGKLTELRVLSISNCQSLTCMPSDLSEFTKLRVLNIRECISLTCMPSDISNLTELRVLSINNSYPERQQ